MVIRGGGAVNLDKGTLRRCYIHDNGRADYSQGGAVNVGNSALIENCLIVNNLASSGISAIKVGVDGSVIRYCTISGNSPSDTRCVRIAPWGSAQFYNNIVWGNTSESVQYDVVISGGNVSFYSNLVTRAISGREAANFTGDPLFVNAKTNDYHLGSRSSAAYGRARPTAAVTTDYALKARDATAPSIGAYEYDPSAAPLGINLTITKSIALPGEATAYVSVIGVEAGDYEVSWFVDETFVGNGVSMTFPTKAYGSHDVRATVTTTDGRTKSAEEKDGITIRTNVAYVNNTGNGTYPFATSATGTNNLAAAVKAIWTDATNQHVVVEAGAYSLSNSVSIASALRIEGPGADKAEFVCDRPQAGWTSITLNHDKAQVSGIKLSNHGTKLVDNKRQDGRAFSIAKGQVRDCIISNFYNQVFNLSGNVNMAGGSMIGCEIVDCKLKENYCKGAGIYMTAGLVSNCLVRGCSDYRYSNNESGAGIYVNGGTVVTTRITGCGRTDWPHDGILTVAAGTARGCVVDCCTKQAGGSYPMVKVTGGTFESSTVVGNTNGTAAVAVSAGTVRNVLVHGNVTTAQLTKSAGTVTYCCYDEATEGENGNRVAIGQVCRRNPKGTYYPKYNSPCYNGGLYQSWMEGAQDIGGNPRVRRGKVDIGAYESDPAGFMMLVR